MFSLHSWDGHGHVLSFGRPFSWMNRQDMPRSWLSIPGELYIGKLALHQVGHQRLWVLLDAILVQDACMALTTKLRIQDNLEIEASGSSCWV